MKQYVYDHAQLIISIVEQAQINANSSCKEIQLDIFELHQRKLTITRTTK